MSKVKKFCTDFKSACLGVIVGLTVCSFQSYIFGEEFDNCIVGFITESLSEAEL